MKRALERIVKAELYYYANGKRHAGAPPGLSGDVTGLRGNVTFIRGNVDGLSGDVTGIRGDVNECGITTADREAGVDVAQLIKAQP